ncbi:MAG TPA: glucokinase [Tepidisphaeraceae bacterium]|nr:glucokinase [Tepidisphaeraceae bacterium]
MPASTTDRRFLVADIGGTNIRIASFTTDPRQREAEITYRLNPATNKPYQVIESLRDYRAKMSGAFAAACLGVAGRVKGAEVQITNRPDLIRRDEVAAVLEVEPSRVLLVNDMPPHLASVDRLQPSEVIEIKPGESDPRGNRAILMPGTGVGVGGAVWVPAIDVHRPFPSEGGHVDFAPRDQQQDALMRFLRPIAKAIGHTHASDEIAFAGEGIRRIYTFLSGGSPDDVAKAPKSEEITQAVATNNLPADDLRARTIELYLKILGAAAGNLALMFTATGGVYLGGSICLTLRHLLATPPFIDAFKTSGPEALRPLMAEVPVRLIDYKDSGLLGAGVLALRLV